MEIAGVSASGAILLRCVAVIAGRPEEYPPPLDVAEEIKRRYGQRTGEETTAHRRRSARGSSVSGDGAQIGAARMLDRAAELPKAELAGLRRFLQTQEDGV